MKIIGYLIAFALSLLMVSCGGSSSSSQPTSTQVPISLSENVSLTQGTSTALRYRIPAPETPLTAVSIDLVKTLEDASITVTPTP